MIALALALLAATAAPAVEVEVLSRLAPRALLAEGGGARMLLAARGDRLLVDGREVAQPQRLPAGTWRLAPPGAPSRAYRGALAVRAERGLLRVRVAMALEEYVAAVVASETAPATPAEALRAQAVVVRSNPLASGARHGGGALCDLAHCQVLRAHGLPRSHLAAARAAARATAGRVLRLPSGAVARAPFHAACAGHTAEPREAFGGDGTGAAAVADPGCPARTWRTSIDGHALARAVRAALLRAGSRGTAAVPARLRAGDLVLAEGRGGWIAEVRSADGRFRLGGDAFARALDGELGWGQARSSRLALADEGGRVVVRGTGAGHGVGLCQVGAALRAARGEGYREILAHYFPGATVGRLAGAPARPAGAE